MATSSLGGLAPQMYRCSFPGCPVPVNIQFSLIASLQRIVRNEDGDRQGILFGAPGHSGTVVESSQSVAVFGADEMRRAIAAASERVVGYYRIRQASAMELTPDELDLAETLFAEPGSVILLIGRRAGNPAANFFFFEHGSYLNIPLLEFVLDVATLTGSETQRARRSDEKSVVPIAPALPPQDFRPSLPPPAVSAKPASARRPSILLWLLAMLVSAAIASVSVALFLTRTPRNPVINKEPAPSAPLAPRMSLRAERQGNDLKVMWDLNSPPVAAATSAILDIKDGATTRRMLMTTDQVRFGSLLYSPQSDQISVRLTTLKDDQSTAHESVLVILSKPAAPPSAGGQPIPAAPFEVKTQRPAQDQSFPPVPADVKTELAGPTRPFVAPVGDRQPNPAVQLEEPPTIGTNLARAGTPAVLPPRSPSPPPPVVIAPNQTGAGGPASSAKGAGSSAANSTPGTGPSKPAATGYEDPVLISQAGARTPPELATFLQRPVAVRVRVDINDAGRVTHVEGIPDKGVHVLLLRAATDAAWRCRFRPARQGQTPVASSVTIVFHFGPGTE